jgi:hypothetical protein
MADGKKIVDPTLSEFYEAMERTIVEKISHETLARISEDSSDSEDFDVESENEDAEDRPWRPSQVVFRKSTIKQGQIDVMRGRYFRDISIVRARRESNVPLPEVDEVVVIRLGFSLDKLLIDVLKTFEFTFISLPSKLLSRWGVWPLASGWEMPKETVAGSSEGGLVYLKYTFKYRSQFDEPNDDWLHDIEATSDELFGAYSRAEDDAMTMAFGGRGKKRLNRVFDVIRFVYPDYCYPSQKQKKTTASVISSTPKPKKVKVLTHHPKRIEMAKMSRPIEGSSSISEPSRSAPTEGGIESAREPELKTTSEQPKALSPLRETELPRASKIPTATPRRRRMASVLDAIMESVKVQTPASAPNTEGEALKKSDEASMT